MGRFDRMQFIIPALAIVIGAIAYLSCDGGNACKTTHDVGGVFVIGGVIALVIALGAEFLEPRR
jgi:hypothetical protein